MGRPKDKLFPFPTSQWGVELKFPPSRNRRKFRHSWRSGSLPRPSHFMFYNDDVTDDPYPPDPLSFAGKKSNGAHGMLEDGSRFSEYIEKTLMGTSPWNLRRHYRRTNGAPPCFFATRGRRTSALSGARRFPVSRSRLALALKNKNGTYVRKSPHRRDVS